MSAKVYVILLIKGCKYSKPKSAINKFVFAAPFTPVSSPTIAQILNVKISKIISVKKYNCDDSFLSFLIQKFIVVKKSSFKKYFEIWTSYLFLSGMTREKWQLSKKKTSKSISFTILTLKPLPNLIFFCFIACIRFS